MNKACFSWLCVLSHCCWALLGFAFVVKKNSNEIATICVEMWIKSKFEVISKCFPELMLINLKTHLFREHFALCYKWIKKCFFPKFTVYCLIQSECCDSTCVLQALLVSIAFLKTNRLLWCWTVNRFGLRQSVNVKHTTLYQQITFKTIV